MQCPAISPVYGTQCRLNENHVGPHEVPSVTGFVAIWRDTEKTAKVEP